MIHMLYSGKRLVLMAALACVCSPVTSYALSVATTDNANTLVNTIVGSGVTLVAGSPTYTGAAIASGTFTGGSASGIGIESGTLLTNGSAELAVGPNDGKVSQDNGLPGSSLLDPLVSPNTTGDASVLTFSFTTTGGNLSFNYVFGSEEYPIFDPSTNSFNDVLGVFLDGKNIALLPGTMDVVSVNSVNEVANSVFYIDNASGTHDIQYDGFTTVLTANVLGLSAGTHTITFAIADVPMSDLTFDSGVFIQAGSFSVAPTAPPGVPEPSTLLLLGSALGAAAIFKRRKR